MAHSPIPRHKAQSEDTSTPTASPAGDLSQSGATPTDEQNIFRCEKCSKTFSRRENLSRHSKTHNALPSHICSRCGKGFTRSDLLKRHYVAHGRWEQPEEDASTPRKRRRLPVHSPNGSGSSSLSSRDLQHGSLEHGQAMDDSQHSNFHSGQENLNHSVGQIQDLSRPYAPGQTQFEMLNYQQLDTVDTSFIPFDFSNFLLPTQGTVGNEWFSYDFYSAMRETGNSWEDQGVPGSYEQLLEARPSEVEAECDDSSQEDAQEPLGTISRVSSPPNEASEEDKWPFQWNPNSRRILEAQPIILADDHPLLLNHDSKYDISETTLMTMKSFLTLPQGREYHQSQQGIFTLPSLPVLNVLISLFFQKFSHQMPVIHHATVNMNTDLPPPLLAAIVVIGATYSHLKHTRRFAIVLLDVVRWHLRIALECDNSLMRNPMIVYAQALICHAGLWNGNKRSFELAEVVRGALVTYIRRLRFGEELKTKPEKDNKKSTVQEEWRNWIREEQQRRLAWAVYALDCQFPSILNLPPTISLGEVRGLGCPCDEEFWFATSARNWKNLLGPASVPPSRSFSAAVGPFLLLTTLPRTNTGIRGEKLVTSGLQILNLNAWSAFLVLMSLQHHIFQFHQESMITRSFIDDEVDDSNDTEEESIKILKDMHAMRRSQLAEALSLFSTSYLSSHRSNTSTPSSTHFQASSLILHHLSTILLDVPLSDLQSSIGKDGLAGITQSLSTLSIWARHAPSIAQSAVLNAIRSIVSLAPSPTDADTAPYSLIAIFLCHIVLYVFAQVASRQQKNEVLKLASTSLNLGIEVKGRSFLEVLERGFGVQEGEGEPKVLLRSAAEKLTRFGTWGGALNLALMLWKRAEM